MNTAAEKFDIQGFWKAVLEQDKKVLREYFHHDACINWHCTNERFTLEEFITANCEYPGEWAGEIERKEIINDLIITVTRVFSRDGSVSFHVTSFIRLFGYKIASVDEYWADDGCPPQWRIDKHVGTAIKHNTP